VDSRLQAILGRLKALRERKKVSAEAIEEQLILGPGWVGRFERAETIPSLDMLFAILHAIGASLDELLEGLDAGEGATEIERYIYAVPDGSDLNVHFRYTNYDAVYRLVNATSDEFTRERVPLDWAMTQHNLGIALSRLGERESGTARLEEAVAAYRDALKEFTRERVPLQWAATRNNLREALKLLNQRR
jgi:transcriptional regulator with XRE-family HTH domain